MKNNPESQSKGKEKRLKALLTLTTIYGVLYLILVISRFFEGPYDLEEIIAYLAFIIFLVGYYYSWRNELIAGIIFIFWWGIMCYLGIFIAETDRGVGVVIGFPMFIIGILFIISWYRKKIKLSSPKIKEQVE